MTNLGKEFCILAREARRKFGISQSILAKEVGCKQSALSMFESGDGTKLNDEVVAKIAEKFGLELPGAASPGVVAISSCVSHAGERGYCPNPSCPSNKKYEVDGRVFARPERTECDPAHGKFCAVCGEVLEKVCPNCGAHLHDGAVCSFCGEPYVAIA